MKKKADEYLYNEALKYLGKYPATKKKISEIKKRKNVPIIVGGTGLYFKTLTDGIVNIPKIPIQIREKVRKLNRSMGNKIFLKKLI